MVISPFNLILVGLNNTMNLAKQNRFSNLLFLIVLIIGLTFGGFGSKNLALAGESINPGCNDLDITGAYTCDVACITRAASDEEEITGFAEFGLETDTIETLEVGQQDDSFYKVSISSGTFSEVEIGPFVDCTLRTATESVSDNIFPVLEEYIFPEASNQQATAFTKIVRNPSQANFKTCKVTCTK